MGGAPGPRGRALAAAALPLLLASGLPGCLDVQGATSGRGAATLPLYDEERYPVLVVEFGVVRGLRLDRLALVEFQAELAAMTGRSRIEYSDLLPLPPQGGDYTQASLRAIHHATARAVQPEAATSGDRAQLRVLILDGGMAGPAADRLVLGTHLAEAGLIAVFPDRYATAHRIVDGEARPAQAELDRHVLLHELGHALGLVDRGVPMLRDHEDPENPGHSANPRSLLHHRPPMGVDGLVHGPRSEFDADDRADVAAYRAVLRR